MADTELHRTSVDSYGRVYLLRHPTERELLILRRYFGERVILSDIGQELGVTAERVRQLRDRALYRMNLQSQSVLGERSVEYSQRMWKAILEWTERAGRAIA